MAAFGLAMEVCHCYLNNIKQIPIYLVDGNIYGECLNLLNYRCRNNKREHICITKARSQVKKALAKNYLPVLVVDLTYPKLTAAIMEELCVFLTERLALIFDATKYPDHLTAVNFFSNRNWFTIKFESLTKYYY